MNHKRDHRPELRTKISLDWVAPLTAANTRVLNGSHTGRLYNEHTKFKTIILLLCIISTNINSNSLDLQLMNSQACQDCSASKNSTTREYKTSLLPIRTVAAALKSVLWVVTLNFGFETNRHFKTCLYTRSKFWFLCSNVVILYIMLTRKTNTNRTKQVYIC